MTMRSLCAVLGVLGWELEELALQVCLESSHEHRAMHQERQEGNGKSDRLIDIGTEQALSSGDLVSRSTTGLSTGEFG